MMGEIMNSLSRCGIPMIAAALLFFAATVFSGTIPSGYENLTWNADFAMVVKRYPRGQSVRMGEEVIYKQLRPDGSILRRNFAFREGKLHAVSITFDKRYVEKKGIENILEERIKQFGEGSMDRSLAPYMLNYIWEGNGSRITLAYAPTRPDMTVIMYERK
jgi:hypothetical protein